MDNRRTHQIQSLGNLEFTYQILKLYDSNYNYKLPYTLYYTVTTYSLKVNEIYTRNNTFNIIVSTPISHFSCVSSV